MPEDRKQVCLRGDDLDFVERLASSLANVDVTVTSSGDPGADHDVVVWQMDGEVPRASLEEIASVVPTLVMASTSRLYDAVDAGARGFLPLDADLDQVTSAVSTIANGGAVIPPELLGQLLRHVVERRRTETVRREVADALTSRELEVYNLAVRGARRDEIAEKLFISPDTVRTHLQRVYKKLGVHSQTELMSEQVGGAPTEETGDT